MAHEVHAATLPRCRQYLRDRGLDSAVVVGDDQLHATQAAVGQAAQEGLPERLSLRGANIHAQHFAPAVAVHAHGDDHRDADDASLLPDLHIGGIDPQVRPIAFDGTMEERIHAGVDLLAQPRHLALGDAGAAHGLHQVIHRPGRDALDVGFLDDRGQRLLGHPPRLKETRKVAALAQLRDLQLDRPGPGLPVTLAIAVALSQTVRVFRAIAGSRAGAHLQFHQPLAGKPDHLAQHVGVRALFQQALQLHHLVCHRWLLRWGQVRKPNPKPESHR